MGRESAPLFLALTRPTRYLGLPIAYFALLSGGSVILFMAVDTGWIFAGSAVAYVALRFMAEREPRVFEIFAATLRATPKTRNRAVWGGDSYSA